MRVARSHQRKPGRYSRSTSEEIETTAPDGYPAIYVRCHGHRMDRCYVKAQRLCPYGYQLVDQPGYGSLLIRCN